MSVVNADSVKVAKLAANVATGGTAGPVVDVAANMALKQKQNQEKFKNEHKQCKQQLEQENKILDQQIQQIRFTPIEQYTSNVVEPMPSISSYGGFWQQIGMRPSKLIKANLAGVIGIVVTFVKSILLTIISFPFAWLTYLPFVGDVCSTIGNVISVIVSIPGYIAIAVAVVIDTVFLIKLLLYFLKRLKLQRKKSKINRRRRLLARGQVGPAQLDKNHNWEKLNVFDR